MTSVESIESKTTTTPDRHQAITDRLNQMPPKCRRTYERAVNGSKAAAIKAMCLECVRWSRAEVRLCTDLGCPLYTVRPFRKSA